MLKVCENRKGRPRIGVIGGGICGLALAHELAGEGREVVLLESEERVGGLGAWFEREGQAIDQFYHCQMPSDDPLLRLIDDVGMTDEMYWRPTRMGFVVDGKRYGFNSALDLLRFAPLSLFERIRFGVVSLLLRQLGRGLDLDRTPIESWLGRLYGKRAWAKVLRPLFLSKFGEHGGQLPSLYIWERLGREKNKALRGYVRGGLKALIGAIERSLTKRGVEVRTGAAVERLAKRGGADGVTVGLRGGEELEFDWVVSTMPVPLLKQAWDGSEVEDAGVPELNYQGVVNALFFLKRPLDNYYWAPVVNSGTDFDGVVEMTELVDTEQYGGCHAAYVMKYCGRDSELFAEDAEAIAERWKSQLVSLYPDLGITAADIEEVRVFKAPFVEPIYPLGYNDLKPPTEVAGTRLLLATSAQVYPRITSWNSSTGLAFEVAALLKERIAEAGETAGVSERSDEAPARAVA